MCVDLPQTRPGRGNDWIGSNGCLSNILSNNLNLAIQKSFNIPSGTINDTLVNNNNNQALELHIKNQPTTLVAEKKS